MVSWCNLKKFNWLSSEGTNLSGLRIVFFLPSLCLAYSTNKAANLPRIYQCWVDFLLLIWGILRFFFRDQLWWPNAILMICAPHRKGSLLTLASRNNSTELGHTVSLLPKNSKLFIVSCEVSFYSTVLFSDFHKPFHCSINQKNTLNKKEAMAYLFLCWGLEPL